MRVDERRYVKMGYPFLEIVQISSHIPLWIHARKLSIDIAYNIADKIDDPEGVDIMPLRNLII